jgi:transcriptional regulator with XRE-family HTH domain
MSRRAASEVDDTATLLAGLASATRTIRARKRLTQADVARRGGLGKHYPGTVELGRANPTVTQIGQLARGLGLSGAAELLREAQDAAGRPRAGAIYAAERT